MKASSQQEENWDDDFDFANSPRNSPVPAAAPIHAFIHGSSGQHTRSRAELHSYTSRDNGLNRNPSNANLKPAAGRKPSLPQVAAASSSKRTRGRWSGNSEEDWDLEMTEPVLSSSSIPPPIQTNATVPHINHAPCRETALHTRRSPSPTMSAFSIPLSAESSLRLHPVHSRGGSSTNFLLHTGRRSVLETEKGRQEKDRRRLRKKSRPSPGVVMDDDVDTFDTYAHTGIPRRYAVPSHADDGDHSSMDDDSDDEDHRGLAQLEEEQPTVSVTAPETSKSSRQPYPNSQSGISRSALTAVPSPSAIPLAPSAVSSRSPNVSRKAELAPPPSAHTPAKLTRKVSNPNVHSKTPQSRSRPLPSTSSPPSALPMSVSQLQQPIRPHSPLHRPHSPFHRSHSPILATEEGHLNDCGSSIAASSHKARQPFLSRLGSLKKWGSRHSPLLSVSRLPVSGISTTAFPTISKDEVDDHDTPSADPVPASSSSIAAASTSHGQGKSFGLLRKSSGLFKVAGHSEPTLDGRGEQKEESKKGRNPFRRISITAVKRSVSGAENADQTTSTQHTTSHPSASKSQTNIDKTDDIGENDSKKTPSGHQRTFSFSTLGRSKLLAGKLGGGKDEDSSELPLHGKPLGPHTLGRSAAMAKAPKLSVPNSAANSSTSLSSQNMVTGSPRLPSSSRIPSPLPTVQASPIEPSFPPSRSGSQQPKGLLPAFEPKPSSNNHKSHSPSSASANQSSGSVSKANQGSVRTSDRSNDSTPKPRRLYPTDMTQARSAGSRHTHIQVEPPSHHRREETVKPSLPLPANNRSKSSTYSESTPKALGGSKPLPPSPDVIPVPATVGRVTGSNMVVRKESPRRSSVGDEKRSTTHTGSVSRRGGELKIPARISMKQGALKRELEAVKDFAHSVDDLKRLQATYQSLLVKHGFNSSSRHHSSRSNPAEAVKSRYAMWWECAELLVDLGGAAPPTVAGTPIHEHGPSFSSPSKSTGQDVYQPSPSKSSMGYSTGTQRSFSSSSSTGDLSSRQIALLQQMLNTPDPRSFSPPPPSHPTHLQTSSSQVTLSSNASSRDIHESSQPRPGHFGVKDVLHGLKWPKDRHGRSGEMSSGSDHVTSDPSTGRGKSNSIDSGDSSHHPMSLSRANHPYSSGTWKKNGTGSRPSVTGMFGGNNAGGTISRSQSASKGSLLDGSSSSAAGLHTTDEGDEGSDWDLESDSGKPAVIHEGKVASHRYPSHTTSTSTSTASSSLDMTANPRLALTPENIVPLLAYAKEVRGRLNECLDQLAKLDKNQTTASNDHYTSRHGHGRTSKATPVGTSAHRA